MGINENIISDMKNYLSGKTLYQTFIYNGVELNIGSRENDRHQYINIDDIRGKNILDLGCATGAECMWTIEKGANYAIGLEIDDEKIKVFNDVIEILNKYDRFHHKMRCMRYDLNNQLPTFDTQIDVVFCFAITQYIKYRKLWHEVPGNITVYVEGGADSRYNEQMLTDHRFKAKLLGYTKSDRVNTSLSRPFFRLTTHESM